MADYITAAEFAQYLANVEGYEDVMDVPMIESLYGDKFGSATTLINSILSRRYSLPIENASDFLRHHCARIAHYEGEKTGQERERVAELYRESIRILEAIAAGTMELIADDGTVCNQAGLQVQSVSYRVVNRGVDWSPQPTKYWYR